MANITFTPALINALAAVQACTDDERYAIAQYLIGVGKVASAPVAPTQVQVQAPVQESVKVRNTTPKECVDTEIHVACLGKGHVKFFTVGEDGKESGVATRYMRCVKDMLTKDELSLEFDKSFERTDVYAKDYTDPQGVFHAKGSHKFGAYVLKKNGKAMAQASVTKWVNAHPSMLVSADAAKAVDDARIERNSKRNERDARKGAKA